MRVRDGMTRQHVISVGPHHSLRHAATKMAASGAGAAVVMDPEALGPDIVSEHEIIASLARGEDPDGERVVAHLASDRIFAQPEWSLEIAATVMVRKGTRHLVVCDRGEVVGVISMRDIVRCWTEDGALCELPAGVEAALVASGSRRPRFDTARHTAPPSNPATDPDELRQRASTLDSIMGF